MEPQALGLPGKPKYIRLDRSQLRWGEIDVEQLIGPDHPARAIWGLVGKLDLRGFEEQIRSCEGAPGAPCFPPRLLVSVWVYGYSQGVASARALERMMRYEPGLRWLCADEVVNHHTLSDFRMSHGERLKDLFTNLLATLQGEGLVDLSTLMHDGTKVRALAGKESFHREGTLRKHWEQARAAVEELERRAEEEEEAEGGRRQRAAQQRAARERVKRMEAALEQWRQWREAAPASKRESVRVSTSEPEARKMKQNDGGWAPSYNVQVSTEARSKLIVAMGVSSAANDTHELTPALERVREHSGQLPERVVADNGYATRDNVEQTRRQKVQLIAPWKEAQSREAGARQTNGLEVEFAPSAFLEAGQSQGLICPEGKRLEWIQQRQHHRQRYDVYEAAAEDCAGCGMRDRCLQGKSGPRRVERVRESEAMQEYLARQQQPAIQQLYKRRKAVAEFPYLWFKGLWHGRQFSVRGLEKAEKEAMWVALAYNIQQWIRLRWVPTTAAA